MAKVSFFSKGASLVTPLLRMSHPHSSIEIVIPQSEKQHIERIASVLKSTVPVFLFAQWEVSAVSLGMMHSRQGFDASLLGLVCHMVCCGLVNDGTLALPSKAVGMLWSCWEKCDSASLSELCKILAPTVVKWRVLPSIENSSSLAQSYVLNSMLERCKCVNGELPSLFSLDYELQVPGGEYS